MARVLMLVTLAASGSKTKTGRTIREPDVIVIILISTVAPAALWHFDLCY